MMSISSIRSHSRIAVGTKATPALLLALFLGACDEPTPVDPLGDAPIPSGETTRTTAVDTAVIGDGVFTAQLEEPWVNQFGFTVIPVGIHVRNVGTEPLLGEFQRTALCAYWPRVYGTSERNNEAVWDPSRRERIFCTLESKDIAIEAGGELQLPNATRIAPEVVLGDSLPEGWYHPTLTIAPFGVFTELKLDSVQLVRP